MIPVAAIAERLRTDPEIAAILQADSAIAASTSKGVYETDIRRAGRTVYPEAWDLEFGDLKTLLMVDDAGGGQANDGTSGAFREWCYVWIFTPDTMTGRADMRTLEARTIARLHRWSDVTTGVQLSIGDRVGPVGLSDSSNARVERIRFQAAGIYAGVEL